MNQLTDQEILELNDLCAAVVDETLTDAQRARLSDWLATSEEARHYYVRAMSLSASLHTYAGETQADAAQPAPRRVRWRIASLLDFRLWIPVASAAAALFFFVLWNNTLQPPGAHDGGDAARTVEFVASITGARGCVWEDGRRRAAQRTANPSLWRRS